MSVRPEEIHHAPDAFVIAGDVRIPMAYPNNGEKKIKV